MTDPNIIAGATTTASSMSNNLDTMGAGFIPLVAKIIGFSLLAGILATFIRDALHLDDWHPK